MTALLSVTDLSVTFGVAGQDLKALSGVGFEVEEGSILAIAGESGSGKSVCAEAIMGILPSHATVTGSVDFAGQDLLLLSERELRKKRGREISMVFQDPMGALDPVIRIGSQLAEAIRAHEHLSNSEAATRSFALLERVGIPDPERAIRAYPHELSGGMQQRVVIATAIAHRPRLIIADEATTALDVTVQAQILRLLGGLAKSTGAAVVLITHDLGIVAGMADRTVVMYGGRVVEAGPTRDVFYRPHHPYTAGLLASSPDLRRPRTLRLDAVRGAPPDPFDTLPGCAFAPRCDFVRPSCEDGVPAMVDVGRDWHARCVRAHELRLMGAGGLVVGGG